MTLSQDHQHRLDDIKKSLGTIGCREGNFMKAELLFFEALSISRIYGNDPEQNSLLSALKALQYNQYDSTKAATRTARQKELIIKKFMVGFRNVLSHKN